MICRKLTTFVNLVCRKFTTIVKLVVHKHTTLVNLCVVSLQNRVGLCFKLTALGSLLYVEFKTQIVYCVVILQHFSSSGLH